MRRSLHIKLVLIMVLLIVSLMVVVGAFLMNSVTGYYIDEFYQQIADAFGQDNVDFVRDLQTAAEEDEEDGASAVGELLSAYAGVLGVDRRNRNFYVLDGTTGRCLEGSAPEPEGGLGITPNISTALLGTPGFDSSVTADYMDAAIPITRGGRSYIVYILDSRETARSLNNSMFSLIIEALVLGLVISILLSFLLSKTMVNPLQRLTDGIEEVARGDFSRKLEVTSGDEIGQLTASFNAMARQLETNIAELEKAEQQRKDFVANVSHELRTPLTNIKSYAETLADDGDLPPEMRRRFLGVILNESDRMAHILQDLLTLSRFDSRRDELRLTRFPFAQVVDDTYQAILMDAQNHAHTVELDLPGSLPEVRADRERIMQVMMNIVSNAIKYTPDGGRIRISAGQVGDSVWMEVDDNGIGIPEGDRDRIFERFYRVDKARSRQSGGTGLGLSIAQEIMRRHEGKLYLVDKAEPGLTIRMELPVRGPREEAAHEE